MGEQGISWSWCATAQKVTGAAHRRAGKPCQDAFAYKAEHGAVVLAVADGHGSERSPHSDVGAQVAVDVATDILLRLQPESGDAPAMLSTVRDYAEEKLPRQIASEWAGRIRKRHDGASSSALEGEDHGKGAGTPCCEAGPPLSGETESEQPAAGGVVPEGQESVDSILVKYGTTLLAVLATTEWLLYLQLGDGDILEVWDDGRVERPLGKDPRLLGGETTSLCMPDAWKDMCVGLRPIVEEAPALVLLSTDGYANSFSSEADFLKTGPDYLRLIREEGWEYVQANLESWLTETSERGSGDDIAVGLLYRHAEGGGPACACGSDGGSAELTF